MFELNVVGFMSELKYEHNVKKITEYIKKWDDSKTVELFSCFFLNQLLRFDLVPEAVFWKRKLLKKAAQKKSHHSQKSTCKGSFLY